MSEISHEHECNLYEHLFGDEEGENMSEKKNPLEMAINSLKQTQYAQYGLWANEHGVDEYEVAIRVLEEWPKWKPLIEAAGKMDGKQLCEYQRGIVNTLNTIRVSAGGIPLWKNSADMQILALLESLPEREEQ